MTIRENTERPVTITEGTNVLAGMDRDRIVAAARPGIEGREYEGGAPELWDGKTAPRIADVLQRWWEKRG